MAFRPPHTLLWRLGLAVITIQLAAVAAFGWAALSLDAGAGWRWLLGGMGATSILLTAALFWITLRAFSRRERRQLEALRSDFAANVSHELRTPITNIKGYVETMLEVGFDDAGQARRFLDIIRRNSDRLAAIVEDILALAWLEQPGTRQSLVRERRELRPILEAVAAQFENAAAARHMVFAIHAERGLTAPVNAQLIEQALANYVSNAIKYGAAESTVTIATRVREEEGQVEIAVTNKGPGIAPEHLPRIFERFYRVDKARSRELGGTGLGLAIVKHIALVHGGSVEVESEAGRGSTFRIVLPAEA